MACVADNLCCEEETCGDPAQAFGFVNGAKWRTCDKHASALIQKQVTVYEIAAFPFIQTPKDAPLYDERRSFVQKGLGSLATLETVCERDWEDWQSSLNKGNNEVYEAVQQTFQEMWLRGKQIYEEMKRSLCETRHHLNHLVLDKNFQLQPQDSALCEAVLTGPLFCLLVGDCRLSVAETLLANCHELVWDLSREQQKDWALKVQDCAFSQAVMGRTEMAAKATVYAAQLGAKFPEVQEAVLLQSQEAPQRLRNLFERRIEREAEKRLQARISAKENGDFALTLRELQRGKDLLQSWDNLELSLRLSNALAEAFAQAGRWEENVLLGQETLSAWNDSHHFEFLQALFYLVDAFYWLKQYSQGDEAVSVWTAVPANSPRCQCILFCIQADMLHMQSRKEEAEQMYEKALLLDQCPSYITISCRYSWASVCKSLGKAQKAELLFGCACDLFAAQFPHSLNYAKCLNALGRLYKSTNRLLSAEDQYVKAISLLSTHFPQSLEYANSLQGCVKAAMGSTCSAEREYLQAMELYSVYYPQSPDYAWCLYHLGCLYQQKEEAVPILQAATQVFLDIGQPTGVSRCTEVIKLLNFK